MKARLHLTLSLVDQIAEWGSVVGGQPSCSRYKLILSDPEVKSVRYKLIRRCRLLVAE